MEELLTEIEESKGDGKIELVVNVGKVVVQNDDDNSIIKNIREDKSLKLSDSKKDSLCYASR